MPKQGSGTPGQGCSQDAGALSLPDLAGVDLRRLRDMDDPALLAAVDEVLRAPGLFAEMWANEGGTGGDNAL